MRSFLFAVLGALAIGSASAQVKPAKANHDKKHAPAPPPPKHHSPAPSPSHTGGSGRGLNINIPKGRVHQFDTDGNLIDISNDQIEYLGGRYQWTGNSFQCSGSFCGIKSYSSNDLLTWKNEGYLFDPNTAFAQQLCGAPFSGNCGRPHILFNNLTSTYVLYVNAGAPGYAVYTSTRPSSGYVYRGRSILPAQPPAVQGGDLSLQIVDGKGYLGYSLIDFTTLRIDDQIYPPFRQTAYLVELTPDYLNTTGPAYRVSTSRNDIVDTENESPVYFKRNGFNYVATSNTCGFCNGTILPVYRSRSLNGPWTRQIISADTCGGQTAGIISLSSPKTGATTQLYYADLHSAAPNELFGVRTTAQGHLFRPLEFNGDGSVRNLDCSTKGDVSFNIVPGSGADTSGLAVGATYSSGEAGSYRWSCDIGLNLDYQTFTAPKTGTLKEIAFPVGANGVNGPLNVQIFRFANDAALFAPSSPYTVLKPDQSFAANTLGAGDGRLGNGKNLIVPANVAVKAGDRIGFRIANGGTVPYCVFRQSTGAPRSSRLFLNGLNQVSGRGRDGQASPVFSFANSSIKFYVNII